MKKANKGNGGGFSHESDDLEFQNTPGVSQLFKDVNLSKFTLYEKYDMILQAMISHKDVTSLHEEPAFLKPPRENTGLH